jgi:superfamily II DNA or RNA helicase
MGAAMNDRDERRRFSKKERSAVFLASDGRSDLSGTPLNEGWHVDHIMPWSKGGATDVTNAQASTPEENIEKSDRLLSLRPWQQQFFMEYQASSNVDYMLAVLPAGGKTIGGLACAKAFLTGSNTRLIVVVPTDPVRKQWRDIASDRFKIELQTKEFRGTLKTEFHGLVTTYAAVASEPTLFRRLCAMHRCMVIFDEIHHAGDRSTWGKSIQQAFENAARRLAMSGTPFKHDGQKIPFLKINPDGFYHIDFPYDYPSALRDGVVREVDFHRYSGSVEIAIGEEIFEFHTDDNLDDDDAAIRLRGLLRSPIYTRGLLKAAHDKLLSVRRSKPDAGALALCIDANHASKVAKLIEEITGESPDIVVSDTEVATSNVEDFRDSDRKWIVAVRMVSEGVDIPRLMVLAFLTNTTTELFFRQAVGRIIRNQGTDFDTEAYCYMPDDARLSEHAAKIEEFQAQIIAEDKEDDKESEERNEAIERRFMEVLGSSGATLAGITTRGRHLAADDAIRVRNLAEEFQIPEAKVAALMERMTGMSPSQQQTVAAPSLEIRLANLRRKCSKVANRVARQWNIEPKDVHRRYMTVANVRQPKMTEQQLQEKLQWLLKKLAEPI